MTEPPRPQVKEAARVYALGKEPAEDLSASTTAAERLDMVATLTLRAWELSGRPWPRVPRAEWPVVIVRPR